MKDTFKGNAFWIIIALWSLFSHSKFYLGGEIELNGDKSVDLLGQIKLKLEIYVSKFKLKAILILLDT